ncbi:MAG: DNA excision repair protein ERCC-2 [Lentisphaeria bacterium]|jgi:DNA excision repair protein ERCC-2
MRRLIALRHHTLTSAQSLLFPFSYYRAGQHNFAKWVYACIRDKQQLLAEAPTGTGKTISTLFPAVKAIGEKIIDTICYLTLKGSAQTLAERCIKEMSECGLVISYGVIQAKDKVCPCRAPPSEDTVAGTLIDPITVKMTAASAVAQSAFTIAYQKLEMRASNNDT